MKLGRYEVVRELGKGAMGIVYLAKDPLIGRLVALKTIRAAAHSDDDETTEFQQRFIREAQAAGILNHPSIVTVFDIGQDETATNFIAMEYVEGQNLKEVLAQGRPLTFEQIGEIIAQVADALDFAHAKGIVHRDVKPANVILIEGNRAKIMDFGIAKIASSVANLTTTGQFLGTPNYMAPEQIKGSPVDGRTDIFALGICLYECLTRRKPFGGDSLTSISYKIVHEPFPPLLEVNPQIPVGYEEIAAISLAKDPAKRYQRARDMAAALRAVARGEKPARIEPLLAEETIVTRERDRLPTIEMPFPEAEAAPADDGPGTRAAAQASQSGPAAPAAKPASARRPPVSDRLRRTFAGVRALPAWRRRIPLPLFFAIVVVLVVALLGSVLTIRRQAPKVPAVDAKAEVQRNRERLLRNEANELLRKGNARAAYAKLEELAKLAPNSPAVSVLMQKLSAIRLQEDLGRQQIAASKEKFDQGLVLFNGKRYAEAIPLLQEAVTLNPADVQAANALKMAQEEQAKALTARAARPVRVTQPGAAVAKGGKPASAKPAAAEGPAQLTTFFASPFNDGYIMVKVGAETLAHENLYEEKGRFIRRKTARTVNVTKELTPKNTDVQVWVIVPSLKISEHRVIRHNFQPGSSQRLQVSWNAQSRTFEFQIN